jgi:hypothetical protein
MMAMKCREEQHEPALRQGLVSLAGDRAILASKLLNRFRGCAGEYRKAGLGLGCK